MIFRPFVYDRNNTQIPISIEPMTQTDAELTNSDPVWQTSWTSEFLKDDRIENMLPRPGRRSLLLALMKSWKTL